MNELAELARLDGLIGGKKQEANLQSAMSNNEKIRDWVSRSDGTGFIFTIKSS
jgi:hypothetical protein